MVLVVTALLAVLLLVIAPAIPFSSNILQRRLVDVLSERLDSHVELAGLELRVLPRFHVEGYGLQIRHQGRDDVPPLIKVDRLTVDAGFANLLRKHVNTVTLSGLEISIPPSNPTADDSRKGTGASTATKNTDAKAWVLDHLVSTDARLVIVPGVRDKPWRVWQIHELAMGSVAFDRPMPFKATLTNAVPPGEIRTNGSFGPWHSDAPGTTPVEGTFTFADADLSIFKGISGMLSAHGEFGGALSRLGVHGETDTANFTVSVGGHPVPLHADYHATVDATNGNTLLDRIDASFLQTSVVAKGGVVGTPGEQGRTVTLDVVMDKARIEDVLKLAVKTPKPPMTGAMKLRTKLILPPGDRDVAEKLKLDGQFEVETAKFTNIDIQRKMTELSHRSRGSDPGSNQSSVVSNFSGRFHLDGGTLSLSTLTFNMPGTQVELAGNYALRAETLNFKGTLRMDAKISQTQKGWKRYALKALDPVFAKKSGGGTDVPIKIAGQRDNPSFGLDMHALFKKRR